MPEDFEEESSKGFDLLYYVDVVRRRHLQFLVPLFLGWVLVWGASWIVPPTYRSATLVLVEQPTMPKAYVTPNINDDLQDRLQSITQQILSRTRLLHIIDKFNLYTSKHAQRSPDDKVQRMRKDIDIELVRDSRNTITAFNVYYSSHDPQLAQRVTSELTNLFINENLEVRQEQSEDTTKFLETQLETSRQTLSTQEEIIRKFKGEHAGELPGQLSSNLQILTGLQSQLQNAEDALNTARQQRVYLQTIVEQYRTMQGPAKAGDGGTLGLAGIDQELEKLKAQLGELSSHYTDRHPDVRKVKEQIAKAQKTRDQIIASMKAKRSVDNSDINPAAVGDPAQSGMLLQVQSQLRSNQVEIANREQAISTLKTKIEDYQARLNQEPIREQQLADLTRGYEQSKATYDDLLKKKNESAMATSMELLQQGQRFRIVDPPSFPQKPEFPNRLAFCAIGLAVGLVLGGGLVAALEFLDDRLYSEDEIRELLGKEVLTEIPVIATAADDHWAERKSQLGWATTAIVVISILAGSAYTYLRG
jgi:succinoglycan biosynthesis transport protein ExoP